MSKKQNPFPVAGYWGPDYFCDREAETASLLESLRNQRHRVLISIRRLGKTALVHHVFHQIPAKEAICIYCDLQPTTNRKELIDALSTALWTAGLRLKSRGKKILEFIKSLRPIVSYDELSGIPQVSVRTELPQQEEHTLKELLALLEKQPKPVFIAFDEFQQIAQYPEKNTEALLRATIQMLHGVSFIFSGSQQHLLQEMFGSAKRPFFGMTTLLQLSPISNDQYAGFIRRQFQKFNITITPEAVDYILSWTRRHTYYTQHICNFLFSHTSGSTIKTDQVRDTCSQVLQQEEPLFYSYQRILTPHQWKLLTSIAVEQNVFQPTSAKFIQKHKLGGPSTVKKTLQSLLDKELIYISNNEEGKTYYMVYNVFLSRWLEH